MGSRSATGSAQGVCLADTEAMTLSLVGQPRTRAAEGDGGKGIFIVSIAPNGSRMVHFNYERGAFMRLEIDALNPR